MGKESDNSWVSHLADLLARGIMNKLSGIQLELRSPSKEPGQAEVAMDAVCCLVRGGYEMKLQFRAEPRMFCRLARNMLNEEPEDAQEVQDYATEFFNVLCGRFVSELHQATQTTVRFSPPWYEEGPESGHLAREGPLSTLYYISEEQELAEFSWTNQPVEQLLKRSEAL